MGRDERDELREVAFVRAHGMRRGVLVEAQVIEEVDELVFHSALAASWLRTSVRTSDILASAALHPGLEIRQGPLR